LIKVRALRRPYTFLTYLIILYYGKKEKRRSGS